MNEVGVRNKKYNHMTKKIVDANWQFVTFSADPVIKNNVLSA